MTRLGLVARYRLEGFLRALVSSASDPKSKAIFLLVPAHEGPGVPAINGELAIPGVLSSHALWLTEAWLKNLHNAAA